MSSDCDQGDPVTFVKNCSSNERYLSKLSFRIQLRDMVGVDAIRPVKSRLKRELIVCLGQGIEKPRKYFTSICCSEAVERVPTLSDRRTAGDSSSKILPSILTPGWRKSEPSCCMSRLKDLLREQMEMKSEDGDKNEVKLTAARAYFWNGELSSKMAV
jgi:hypothetical protein